MIKALTKVIKLLYLVNKNILEIIVYFHEKTNSRAYNNKKVKNLTNDDSNKVYSK